MELLTKASYSNIANARERKNLKTAYEAACESIVLLENDGTLPFEGKKVAIYGAGASKTIKGGTGSGEVNERHSTTILEGMEQAGFEVTTKAWIKDFEYDYEKAEALFRKNKWKNVVSNPMSLCYFPISCLSMIMVIQNCLAIIFCKIRYFHYFI